MKEIKIHTPDIKLSQFLKWAEITASGGEAKNLIREGKVKVNGEVIIIPGKKLHPGDLIEVEGEMRVKIAGDG